MKIGNKVSSKTYRCVHCGVKSIQVTNHYWDIYSRCKNPRCISRLPTVNANYRVPRHEYAEISIEDYSKPDPHDIIGYYVPAADGLNYGHYVHGYDVEKQDYLVHPIQWDIKKTLQPTPHEQRIDVWKITYRYYLGGKEPSLALMKRGQ